MNGRSFFSELKRRRVLRSIGFYAVTAWAVVEAAATILPLLGFPESAAVWAVYLALLGFPVVLAGAWMFDLTARGVVRTPDADVPPPAHGAGDVARGRAAGIFGAGMLVALVAFAAVSRFGPDSLRRGPAVAAGIESIAVLPFTDLSEAGDQQYFSDGMTEELLNRLTHVEGLDVKARSSSFEFRGQRQDVAEIGRRLGVQAILDGTVRREGGRLRINAKLVDTHTGNLVWSESYDREVSSVFAIQDSIATAIVAALEKQFTQLAPVAADATTNIRAHDEYLLGLEQWHSRTFESVQEAITHFESATRADPEYSPAWAGLAQAYAVLPALGGFPVAEAVAKGSSAAQALALNAQLAEAHGAIGQIAQNFEWDLGSAERAYRRAVTFEKGYATGHQWYAEVLMMLGRYDEARAEIDTALELDPLSAAAMTVRAYLLMVQGNDDSALEAYRSLLARRPDYALGQINLALLATHMRRFDIAEAAVRAGAGDAQTANALAAVVTAIGDPAHRASGVAALRSLDERLPGAITVLWWSALGEREEALTRLERIVAQQNDANLPYVLLHPLLAPLRHDARFQAIVETVGVVLSPASRSDSANIALPGGPT
ncbi:MAG: FlgO family outer membrane protein [Longimicrobiales bacterium]